MGISDSEARHLMRRAGFGALDPNIADLMPRSRSSAVDRVMWEAGTPQPNDVPSVGGLSRSEGQRVLAEWWIGRMAGGAAPIIEKMVLFWHSHFACTIDRVKSMELMRKQHLVFRQHALGDFHDLCQAIAIDPAMLIDLDNASNVVGDEQENFARELMELYTIGNGMFSEDEVVDMSRAWTGHGIDGDDGNTVYRFYPENHDNGSKTLFGITQNWNGPATITELVRGVRKEQTAWFLAVKLWRYFASPSVVPAEAVQAVQQSLLDNAMVVKPALRTLFLRDEFWDPSMRYGMVKPPAPWMAELRRRTGQTVSAGQYVSRGEDMGQELFAPPSVAGWGHDGVWLSSTPLLTRARMARDLRNRVQGAGWFSGLKNLDRAEVADRIVTQFGVPDASDDTRQVLFDWADEARAELNATWFEREAFRVGAMMPEVNLA